MITFKLEGVKELEAAFRRLGNVPQSVLTKAVKKGATILLKSAKAKAPEDTGTLKKGLYLKAEKSKVKGKKVYQVTFNPAYNSYFVKISKAGKRAYYPASQEYGFKARNGRYIPGYSYLRKSMQENESRVAAKIIDELKKEVDKLLGK